MAALPVGMVLLTVEEYLAGEERSEIKHEYLAGVPHAMAGGSLEHSAIAFTLCGMLYAQLEGSDGVGFNSDTKLKVQLSSDTYFFYPDAMIVCGSVRPGATWCESPRVIFEVLSDSTRAIDEGEKRMAYFSISSVVAYARIEQDKCSVTVERRTNAGWVRELLTHETDVLRLPMVQVEIPLAKLYKRVAI